MTHLEAVPAADHIHLLAEGPVWDGPRERLLWVDIEAGEVLTGTLHAGRVQVTSRTHVDVTVGAVAPTIHGDLVVAARETVVVLGMDGSRREVARVLPPDCGRRLNDAAVDPTGRLLAGSRSLTGAGGHETLHRLEPDGRLTTLDDDLTLSNGIGWSPAGSVLYTVDTLAGVVRVRDHDPVTGATGPWRPLIRLEQEWPDGLRVDADGNLWLAVWGSGQVRCYRPDGELLHVVEVAAHRTSAVTFAGPDLGTLVITTASDGLTPQELASHPSSGRLFTLPVGELAGVRGLPTTPWRPIGRRSLPAPRPPE